MIRDESGLSFCLCLAHSERLHWIIVDAFSVCTLNAKTCPPRKVITDWSTYFAQLLLILQHYDSIITM